MCIMRAGEYTERRSALPTKGAHKKGTMEIKKGETSIDASPLLC